MIDAVGPETLTFEDLVRLIARTIGRRARFVHVPPAVALGAAAGIGWVVGDVVVTREELDGLMAGLVTTEGPATGTRRLSAWLTQKADTGPTLCLGDLKALPPRSSMSFDDRLSAARLSQNRAGRRIVQQR